MDEDARGILGNRNATGEQVRRAWEQASLAAMDKHRETGVPVVTWDWENGRVLLIPAENLPRPDEHSLVGDIDSEQKA